MISLLIYTELMLASACDMACKMGCDTFNGVSDCYNFCSCKFKYSPIPVSTDLKEKAAKYQVEIFQMLQCADNLTSCTGSYLEQSRCYKENGCKVENGTALAKYVPKELWIAVQPSAIKHTVEDEQLEKYKNYQQCASYCDELCINSKDSIETCSQNCMMQFCYSYDYTTGGYYETQIAEKKTEEIYPDYIGNASAGAFAFLLPIAALAVAYYKYKE